MLVGLQDEINHVVADDVVAGVGGQVNLVIIDSMNFTLVISDFTGVESCASMYVL